MFPFTTHQCVSSKSRSYVFKKIKKHFDLYLCWSGNLILKLEVLRNKVNGIKYSITTNLGCHHLWLTLEPREEGCGDWLCYLRSQSGAKKAFWGCDPAVALSHTAESRTEHLLHDTEDECDELMEATLHRCAHKVLPELGQRRLKSSLVSRHKARPFISKRPLSGRRSEYSFCAQWSQRATSSLSHSEGFIPAGHSKTHTEWLLAEVPGSAFPSNRDSRSRPGRCHRSSWVGGLPTGSLVELEWCTLTGVFPRMDAGLFCLLNFLTYWMSAKIINAHMKTQIMNWTLITAGLMKSIDQNWGGGEKKFCPRNLSLPWRKETRKCFPHKFTRLDHKPSFVALVIGMQFANFFFFFLRIKHCKWNLLKARSTSVSK